MLLFAAAFPIRVHEIKLRRPSFSGSACGAKKTAKLQVLRGTRLRLDTRGCRLLPGGLGHEIGS